MYHRGEIHCCLANIKSDGNRFHFVFQHSNAFQVFFCALLKSRQNLQLGIYEIEKIHRYKFCMLNVNPNSRHGLKNQLPTLPFHSHYIFKPQIITKTDKLKEKSIKRISFIFFYFINTNNNVHTCKYSQHSAVL